MRIEDFDSNSDDNTFDEARVQRRKTRRKKARPAPPDQAPSSVLIEEYIKKNGVTKCRPAYAIGSVMMHNFGFE